MDALYIINLKSKEILLAKEFFTKDNNIKIQIFLSEIQNILKEEISPIININNSIFIYKHLNSVQSKNTDESNIMLVALVSQDVNNFYLIKYKNRF